MKLLTTTNIKKNLWISDSKNRLGKIIHVHSSIADHMSETPFIYHIHGGNRVYAEIGPKQNQNYKIVPSPIAYFWRKQKELFTFIKHL